MKGAIDLSNGALPAITGNVTITGPGANVLTIDAQDKSQILSIGSGANVTISGLTLADGHATGFGGRASTGGAIHNFGTLTLISCALTNNNSPSGGAIFNDGGRLTMTGCTVAGNTANAFGGGILNVGNAT